MYKYENILVPTDFSDGSQIALNNAKEIAQSMDANIHLLHVIQSMAYPTGIEIAHESLVNLEKDLHDAAEKKLKQICTELEQEGIKCSYGISMGKPSDQIIGYSGKKECDLVVIATHGAGGIEHFLFGSTTEKVIRKVECPILVAHYPKEK